MFRSIRRILLSASGKKSRGRAPSRRASRQLGFEGLEGRKMLSSTTAAANPFGDCSFETPVLTANAFQYAPGGSAWQFSTSAGISSNGSVFTAANPKAPDGSQVAFLQGYGSMTQSVNLSAGDYSITFLAAQRATKPQTHFQQIEVLVDGAEVGFATPSSTSYDSYRDVDFHSRLGCAYRRVRGAGSAGRRQHRLPRQRGRLAPDRHDRRRRLRGPATGRRRLPVFARRFTLAVLQRSGGGRQRQCLYRGQSQCALRHSSRFPPGKWQYEPIDLPGCGHL